MKILISACLLGMNCRYCGGGCLSQAAAALFAEHDLMPVCPEQMGGLPTPRAPDEIRGGRVLDRDGIDNTAAFERGAEEVLKLARLAGCTAAVLKERSPSCGSSVIYDGTFTGRRVPGAGITARLLMENGIKVVSEERIPELFEDAEES